MTRERGCSVCVFFMFVCIHTSFLLSLELQPRMSEGGGTEHIYFVLSFPCSSSLTHSLSPSDEDEFLFVHNVFIVI